MATQAVTPAERFRANAERRTNAALEEIRKLKFVANRRQYEFTQAQADAILTTLRAAIDDLDKAFNPPEKQKTRAPQFQLPLDEEEQS